MNAILVTDAPADSAEWHAARRNGIGASEISAVVGLNPWMSAFQLWHVKKGNLPEPDGSNPLFYWGHALEPLVAYKFSTDHFLSGDILNVSSIGTHRHADREWQYANLDRRVNLKDGTFVPLEIKTTKHPDNWGPSGTDQIPVHVRCQVMQQMDVFGAPYAWVAVLIGGSDYREYRIDFDESDAAALRDAGTAFWASLQTDDEPPIDASWSTYEAVRELHPNIDPDLDIELDPNLWAEYRCTKDNADDATEKHRKAKSELLAALGNARRGLYFGNPVIRRQPGRNGSVSLYPVKEAS